MKLKRLAPHLKDSELSEQSHTLHLAFTRALPKFEAFDPSLNAAFAAAWKAAIIKIDGHPSDENTVDELQDCTQLLNEATDRALGQIKGLEYFIWQAYPGKEYKLAEFGLDSLARKRKSNFAEMVDHCFIIHERVLDFEADLLAAGMPPTYPAQLLAAIQDMDKALRKQRKFKLIRIEQTNERINRFNYVYNIHRQIAKAARVIFIDKPIEMKIYIKL